MAECICTVALVTVLGVSDLVDLVHSYLPRMSDKDILLGECEKFTKTIYEYGAFKQNNPFDIIRKITVQLNVTGVKIPNFEVGLWYCCNSGDNGVSGSLSIFDDNSQYVPDLLMPRLTLSGFINDQEFAEMYDSVREKMHNKIVRALARHPCRLH